jgi:hypothetical protein
LRHRRQALIKKKKKECTAASRRAEMGAGASSNHSRRQEQEVQRQLQLQRNRGRRERDVVQSFDEWDPDAPDHGSQERQAAPATRTEKEKKKKNKKKTQRPAELDMPFSPTSPNHGDELLTPISPSDPSELASPKRKPRDEQPDGTQRKQRKKKKKKKHRSPTRQRPAAASAATDKHGDGREGEEDTVRYNSAGRPSSRDAVREYKAFLTASRKLVADEDEGELQEERVKCSPTAVTRKDSALARSLAMSSLQERPVSQQQQQTAQRPAPRQLSEQERALFRACCYDDVDALRKLFDQGAPPDARNANDESLLDLAKDRKCWRAHSLIAARLSSAGTGEASLTLHKRVVFAAQQPPPPPDPITSCPLSPMSPNTKGLFLRQELRKKSNIVEHSLTVGFPEQLPAHKKKPAQRRRRPSVNEAVNTGALKLSKFGAQGLLAGALAKTVIDAGAGSGGPAPPKARTEEISERETATRTTATKPRRRRPSVQEVV